MSDDANTEADTTGETTTVVVVPVIENDSAPDDSGDRVILQQLEVLSAQVSALQTSLDAHYAAHAEIELEESDENDGTDNSATPDTERDSAEETGPASERPIRRGLGGWLFGPIKRQ
jgi:hypothetical protein